MPFAPHSCFPAIGAAAWTCRNAGILLLAFTLHPSPSHAKARLVVDQQQILHQKMLRGYGSLAGRWTEYHNAAGRKSSLLMLYSPSPEKASLALGKYNSDLYNLGPVIHDSLSFGSRTVPISDAGEQGSIAAFRQGPTTYIVAAEDRADLVRLLRLTPLAAPGPVDFIGGAVPVYLNFFDKYGWGFYYDLYDTPPGQELTYDHRQDYDFAKKNGVTMHFEAGANYSDTAEGIVAWPKFEAGVDMARQRDIPAYVAAFGKSGPLWLHNIYPFDEGFTMPDFVGRLYGPGFDAGAYGPFMPMWSSREGENVQLNMLAPIVRKYSKYPNVAEFMEPHEEIEHSTPAIFADYGPVADAAYQGFLRGRYGSPQAVDGRWYGGAGKIRQWSDVRAPEVASFLGWGPGAFDLKGVWRISPDSALTPAALTRWDAPDLDDSKWAQLMAPGDDRAIFRPASRNPGIFRRTFDLPAGDLNRLKTGGGGKVYLYIWDLEGASQNALEAALNGTSVGKFTNPSYDSSWCSFEVSAALKGGANQLSLHLPWGELCYKIYLSSHPPHCYPDLSPGEDARWVDFRDFTTWSRGDSIRRGDEMIRREDKDRFIRQDSPYGEFDVEKSTAEDFGSQFHDTGAMAGFWYDVLPSMARSSGLPTTAEAGNAAHNPPELKKFFGRWSTEGLNGIDYFQKMGDIQWDPTMRAWFEANQPLVHLFGKYHAPRAQVAVLQGEESAHLTGFPWNKINSDVLWQNRRGPLGVLFQLPCPRDLVVENDFERGNADRYHVIIADNNFIMDAALLAQIEKWVRAGGIFITYGHTGQHSPLAANTWPISRLTGYRVVGPENGLEYRAIAGQPVLRNPIWSTKDADGGPHRMGGDGLRLQKVAPECKNVLAWEKDQGVALGVRPLGKGFVIAGGTVFSGGPNGSAAVILPDLLSWCGVKVGLPTAEGCRVASYVSNSGLYDVTVLWGEGVKTQTTTSLHAPDAASETMQDVSTGATITGTMTNGAVAYDGLPIGPDETRAFLSPRHAIAAAPFEWLLLQRDWWQGTRKPAPAPPYPVFPNTLDLTMDNAFSPVPAGATDLTPYVGAKVDDQAWKRLDFGIWSAAYPNVTRGVFRKKFVIPARWKDGQSWLWINAWDAVNFRPPYRNQVFLDGTLIEHSQALYDTMIGDFTKQLTPGPHLLAVVSEGSTSLNGLISNVWVEHLPEPTLRQSLAGSWGNGIVVPGNVNLAGARRTFTPLPAGKGKTVMLWEDGAYPIASILINGRWLSRSYGLTRGTHFRMNLTPYIKWGQENDIELRPTYAQPFDVKTVEVRYYEPGTL